jgi:hypothetical protein
LTGLSQSKLQNPNLFLDFFFAGFSNLNHAWNFEVDVISIEDFAQATLVGFPLRCYLKKEIRIVLEQN